MPKSASSAASLAARVLALALLLAATGASFADAPPTRIQLPRTGLVAADLALLINDDDPDSREIGHYYQQARGIPPANVIHLRFPPGRAAIGQEEFASLKALVDRLTPPQVQAFAVAWTTPYRVGCMSLTSALAFGFDEAYCSTACGPTAPSAYFDAAGVAAGRPPAIRPAMMLAGRSVADVKALIDRGVAADQRFPAGRAYLLSTPDKARNVRAPQFPLVAAKLAPAFPVEIVEARSISGRDDVMFYFTGLARVPDLDSLGFLPGALADHLTSTGGQLTDSSQMSVLRWLEAGATASYGTVVEPCNHPQKFPAPGVAMFHYLLGASAIEAYWKSVAWPGEGVFVGEPLARPFAPRLDRGKAGEFVLQVFVPAELQLLIESAASPAGPYRPLEAPRQLKPGLNRIDFPAPPTAHLRLRW